MSITIDQHDLGILLVCAERYSATGGGYAPDIVPGIVRRVIESVDDSTLRTLIHDLDYSLNGALPHEKMAFREPARRDLFVQLLQQLSSERSRRRQEANIETPIAFDGGAL